MSEGGQSIEIVSVPAADAVEAFRRTRPFADVSSANLTEALAGMSNLERVTARAGTVLVEPKVDWHYYWLVLAGEINAERPESDGSYTLVGTSQTGDGFGETPILTGKSYSPFRITAGQDSLMMRVSDGDFWKLMSCCPSARKVILADVAQRLQAYQVEALHREKLVSLGTLAAGLMHELHNPGSAAKRAASQLRENLLRMQQLSLRSSTRPRTPQQLDCIKSLLEHAVSGCR